MWRWDGLPAKKILSFLWVKKLLNTYFFTIKIIKKKQFIIYSNCVATNKHTLSSFGLKITPPGSCLPFPSSLYRPPAKIRMPGCRRTFSGSPRAGLATTFMNFLFGRQRVGEALHLLGAAVRDSGADGAVQGAPIRVADWPRWYLGARPYRITRWSARPSNSANLGILRLC